jgi:uncharacterized protein YqeY
MGKVMGKVMAAHRGEADGTIIKKLVMEALHS